MTNQSQRCCNHWPCLGCYMHRRFGIWTEIVQNKKDCCWSKGVRHDELPTLTKQCSLKPYTSLWLVQQRANRLKDIELYTRKENEHVDLAVDDHYEGGSTWWWPYKLIGDANKWIERAHHATMRGCLTYHLIQFFSSHGSFSSYWSSKDNPIQVCVLLVQK